MERSGCLSLSPPVFNYELHTSEEEMAEMTNKM